MAQWMKPAGKFLPDKLGSVIFRNQFHNKEKVTLDFEFSADPVAVIFFDGEVLARGPERGSPERWYKSRRIRLTVAPGTHVLSARVVWLDYPMRPYGQMSLRKGFYCHELSRVLAPLWESLGESDAEFRKFGFWGGFALSHCLRTFPYQAYSGGGSGWTAVDFFEDIRVLHDPDLPPMRDEEVSEAFKHGNFYVFEQYVCVWAEYLMKGPGTVKIRWSEVGCSAEKFSPQLIEGTKPGGGLVIPGESDVYDLPEGEVRIFDFHWKAGRLLEIRCENGAAVLSKKFHRTGYPYDYKVDFRVPGDPAMTKLLAMSRRTLEACSDDTYMDCPFYEQLQYISDVRVEALATYAVASDYRLIEKAIRFFSLSVRPDGELRCRYPVDDNPGYSPAVGDLYQPSIPSFMMFYISLVHDYALYGGQKELISEVLPATRKIIGYLKKFTDCHSLLHVPGWNFLDWLPHWKCGVAPGCINGGGASLNLIFIQALRDLADLESFCGDKTCAASLTAEAGVLAQNVENVFFSQKKQLYWEDESRTYMSEHAQVLALLILADRRVLPGLRREALDQCGIYFSLYSLEAFRLFGETTLFDRRKQKYLDFGKTDLTTLPECFPNQWWERSECHAWSSHFLYHHYRKRSFTGRL